MPTTMLSPPPLLHLVSCVSKKRSAPAPAQELYLSPWFSKARAYVQARGGPWYILSAEHGLLHPEHVIAPYNRTLNAMKIAARRAWAACVVGQLERADIRAERIVVLAGRRYREFLMADLQTRTNSLEVPMAELGIGQQLAWLSANR